MKWYHQVLIAILLISVCLISGCSTDEIYLCNSCNASNTTSRSFIPDPSTAYCSSLDKMSDFTLLANGSLSWTCIPDLTGTTTIYVNTTNNITNNYTLKVNSSTQCANPEYRMYNVTLTDNVLTSKCGEDVMGGADINISNYYNKTTDYANDTATITNALIPYSTTVQDALSDLNYWGCQRNNTLCDGDIGQSAKTVATAFTNTVLRCFPFVVSKSFVTDRLGFVVSVANITTGGKVALYSDNGFAFPNALLINTSNIPLSATGFMNQSITPYRLTNNTLYWLCNTVNVTSSARVNVISLSDYPQILGCPYSGTACNIGYTVAYVYTNALPNPYNATATLLSAISPNANINVRTDI
jgi:hypothetical protein